MSARFEWDLCAERTGVPIAPMCHRECPLPVLPAVRTPGLPSAVRDHVVAGGSRAIFGMLVLPTLDIFPYGLVRVVGLGVIL